jgi:3-oxoacid CoA-transferase
MSKLTAAGDAVADIADGASLAVGGFGLCGIPVDLISELAATGVRGLRVVSNNCGVDDWGLGILLRAGQIARMTSSYMGEHAEFSKRFTSGELEVELVPQGTLAERLRAGGAGIPAFYTPVGTGTDIAAGGMPVRYGPAGEVAVASAPRETRLIGDVEVVLEHAIVADFALVRAAVADTDGNLVFHSTARNFNPLCAMAGRVTIAEAERVVPAGSLDPDHIHLPGIFVQRVVQADRSTPKRIEKTGGHGARSTARARIAARGARELRDGMYVNLGIGLPTAVPSYLDPACRVLLHSENGLLGAGPFPAPGEADPDIINAGKEPVTLVAGASVFDSALSFAMVRGGHLDLALLGGMEVSARGDLANWMVTGKLIKGMGGAMDIVRGAKRVVVLMEHRARDGSSKLVAECGLPLTGRGVVNRVITDLAVLDVTESGFVLREVAPGITADDVRHATAAPVTVGPDVTEMAP